MVSRRKEKNLPTILGGDQYDESGWPKESLSVVWRSFNLAQGPYACWIAEYGDLPGYCGEGASVQEALDNLWQDFGPRPHFRVERKRRNHGQWRRYFEARHNAWAASAFLGFDSRSSDAIASVARDFPARFQRIQEENRAHRASFNPLHGRLVAGKRRMETEELQTLTAQKIELSLFVATNTPWRLERQEARDKFPVLIG
jgi:hypothetical protein